MKKISLLLVACLVGLTLFESKPKTKGHYIKSVAQDFQSLCCSATSASTSSACERLRPITQPIVQGILHAYTDAPQDYVFFTRYTTRLPNQTIYGIGIAGQFISWTGRPDRGETCEILYSTFMPKPM